MVIFFIGAQFVVETFQFEGWLYYDKNYHIIFYPIFPL